MRYCPKCRSFYDDAQLRFCLVDGVPLADVRQTDGIWNEGASFIRETQRRVTRETRIRQLKKVVSILITTVLVIMVVSVITLNSWIYLSEPEEEIVRNVAPSPTKPPEGSPQPAPSISPESTPSPEPTPTDSPTPTRTRTPTPTPTPTATPTPTPDLCSPEKRAMLQQRIEAQNAGTWREKFLREKSEFVASRRPEIIRMCERRTRNSQMCEATAGRIEAQLDAAPTAKRVLTSDCNTVTATVTFRWLIVSAAFPQFYLPHTKSFSYPVK